MDKFDLYKLGRQWLFGDKYMSDYDLPLPAILDGNYSQGAKMARMPTMKERLELAVREAENRLTDAKRAKEIFDKNPELEELLNIM